MRGHGQNGVLPPRERARACTLRLLDRRSHRARGSRASPDAAPPPDRVVVEWDGLAGYISFDVNDAVSIGARAEYFNDDDGFRLGAGNLELWEGTLTARFKLRDGLVTSLEYRHDESSDGELVFDDFTEDTQDTIALEIVGSF